MPIISKKLYSRFNIKVELRYNEHNPPHLHITYKNQRCMLDLDGRYIRGNIDRDTYKIVYSWIQLHNEEIKSMWMLAYRNLPIGNID